MKKYIILLLLSCWIGSCSNYLDLKPKNVLTPQTLDDVKTIAAKYFEEITSGVFRRYSVFNTVGGMANHEFHYMDCDIEFMGMFPMIGELNKHKFQWIDTEFQKNVWFGIYSAIGDLNLSLYELERVEGDDTERRQLKAELLMHRALLFTKLLEYFTPYAPNEYAKEIDRYGLPFLWGPEDLNVNLYPQRVSQKETFRLILGEVDKIQQLNVEPGVWNMLYNERTLHGLFAEIYWWKAESCAKEATDWENARKHALLCIADHKPANNEEELAAQFDPFVTSELTPFKLVCANTSTAYSQFFSFIEAWAIAEDLYSSYAPEDIRLDQYYATDFFGTKILKKFDIADKAKKRVMTMWRVEEMWMIVAESYARTGDKVTAQQYLKDLQDRRVTTFQGNTGDILQDILSERRREFALEGNLRWLDMKRMGIKIDRDTPIDKVFTLEKNDFRYTFQIPVDGELDVNPNNFQNPGWDIVKFD
ncbi:MAG: RagB/SusD family nutrient uptake outer membrane protein [Odoribacter sp.]